MKLKYDNWNFISNGNRFLMNKIKIKLSLMKNTALTKEMWIFTY